MKFSNASALGRLTTVIVGAKTELKTGQHYKYGMDRLTFKAQKSKDWRSVSLDGSRLHCGNIPGGFRRKKQGMAA